MQRIFTYGHDPGFLGAPDKGGQFPGEPGQASDKGQGPPCGISLTKPVERIVPANRNRFPINQDKLPINRDKFPINRDEIYERINLQ